MDKLFNLSNYFYSALLLFYVYYFVALFESRKDYTFISKNYSAFDYIFCSLRILNDDEENNSAKKSIVYQIIILFYVVLIFFSNGLLQMVMPDDIRVLDEGTYSYYVKYENGNGKKYYLPAEIKVYDSPTEDEYSEESRYHLQKVYFSKNQYIKFEPTSLKIDKDTYAHYTTRGGYDYDVTITLKNNRVFGEKYVKDDNHFSNISFAIFIIKLIILIYSAINVFTYSYTTRKKN